MITNYKARGKCSNWPFLNNNKHSTTAKILFTVKFVSTTIPFTSDNSIETEGNLQVWPSLPFIWKALRMLVSFWLTFQKPWQLEGTHWQGQNCIAKSPVALSEILVHKENPPYDKFRDSLFHSWHLYLLLYKCIPSQKLAAACSSHISLVCCV